MTTITENNPYLAVREAFDAPWPGPRGESVTLENQNLSVTLFPEDGCRITSLTAFGYELLRQWNPLRRAFQYGCFPMIPWVGRLGNATLDFENNHYALPANKPPHALHGMACYGAWQVISSSASAVECHMEITECWPWPCTVTQKIALSGDALLLSLTIRSKGDRFPAAAGWHPWFNKWTGVAPSALPGNSEDELRIVTQPDWQEEPGTNELPTGKRIAPQPGPWDDCFGFAESMQASLLWPRKIRLDMTSPAKSMVIFDKQPDAACVEPLSGPPNGVNTQPHIVTPHSPLTLDTRWCFSSLE
jgi:aldose 1-epimerase